MILKTMWGKRASCDDPPELMVAWDGCCVDDNQGGFDHECAQEREAWGTDLAEWRMIDIHLSEHAIRQAFDAAVTAGSVVAVEQEES